MTSLLLESRILVDIIMDAAAEIRSRSQTETCALKSCDKFILSPNIFNYSSKETLDT